jgi:hypothetical protein
MWVGSWAGGWLGGWAGISEAIQQIVEESRKVVLTGLSAKAAVTAFGQVATISSGSAMSVLGLIAQNLRTGNVDQAAHQASSEATAQLSDNPQGVESSDTTQAATLIGVSTDAEIP